MWHDTTDRSHTTASLQGRLKDIKGMAADCRYNYCQCALPSPIMLLEMPGFSGAMDGLFDDTRKHLINHTPNTD